MFALKNDGVVWGLGFFPWPVFKAKTVEKFIIATAAYTLFEFIMQLLDRVESGFLFRSKTV